MQTCHDQHAQYACYGGYSDIRLIDGLRYKFEEGN